MHEDKRLALLAIIHMKKELFRQKAQEPKARVPNMDFVFQIHRV